MRKFGLCEIFAPIEKSNFQKINGVHYTRFLLSIQKWQFPCIVTVLQLQKFVQNYATTILPTAEPTTQN